MEGGLMDLINILFAKALNKGDATKNYVDEAIKALETALTIHSNSNDWREDANLYNGLIEDRLSLFYYYQKQDYLKAIEYSIKAMRINPHDERLINNYKFFSEKYLETMKGNEDYE